MPKFVASVDKDTHVGTFHGTAGSIADCKSLGSQMVSFCDGLPVVDRHGQSYRMEYVYKFKDAYKNCVSSFGPLSDKFNFAVNIQGPSSSDLAPEGMTLAFYLDPSKPNVQTATINGVEFRALRDDGAGRASMRAVATTVDDCRTIAGVPTSEKTNDGFCDVFQGADRDNCIELFNTRVEDCKASVGDSGKAFEFDLSYASSKPLTPSGKSEAATKSDKAPALPALPSASAAVGERTFGDKNTKTITKVVGNDMSVTASYVPSLNRAAIKSTVTSSKDCDALAALASTDDESGFCDVFEDSDAWQAHKDCTTGFKCWAAFADKDTKSYDFLFVFGGKPGDTSVTEGDKSDSKKASAAKSKKTDGKPALASSELGNAADTTKTTKIVGDDVSVSASYVHSLNRAAVKATVGSAKDCDAVADLATAKDGTGFCDLFEDSDAWNAHKDCMAGFAAAAGKCKTAFKDSGADKYDFSFVFGGVAEKDQTVPASAQAASDRKEDGVLDALVKVDDKLLASIADPVRAPAAASESPKAESATSKSTTVGSLDKVEFQRDGVEFTALRDREVSQAGLKATLEGDAQCETAAGVATEFCSAFTGEEDCVEHFTKYTADCSQFFDSASKSAQSFNFMFAYAGTLAAGTPGFLAAASTGNNGVAKYSASWARVPVSLSDSAVTLFGDPSGEAVRMSRQGVDVAAWRDAVAGRAGLTAGVKDTDGCESLGGIASEFCDTFEDTEACESDFHGVAGTCAGIVDASKADDDAVFRFSFVYDGEVKPVTASAKAPAAADSTEPLVSKPAQADKADVADDDGDASAATTTVTTATGNVPLPGGGSLAVSFSSDTAADSATLAARPASAAACAELANTAGPAAPAGQGFCDMFEEGDVRGACEKQFT
ncbi:hypothetical protein HK405_007961, partial [Cladochytrium tenue]